MYVSNGFGLDLSQEGGGCDEFFGTQALGVVKSKRTKTNQESSFDFNYYKHIYTSK